MVILILRDTTPEIVPIVLVTILSTIFLCLALHSLTAHVTATAEGLSWRYLLRTHRVAWADVRDYYEIEANGPSTRRRDSDAGRPMQIMTVAGLCQVLPAFAGDIPAFRERVRQSATAAHSSDWYVYGTRPACDWPLPLNYRTASNRFLSVLNYILLALGPGAWLAMLLPMLPRLQSEGEQLGWVWPLITVVLTFLGMCAPALSLGAAGLVLARDLARRQGQEITVTDEGLLLTEGGQRLLLHWQEITRCTYRPLAVFKRPAVYTVIAAAKAIEFTPHLDRSAALCRIIEQQSMNAATPLWSPPDR